MDQISTLFFFLLVSVTVRSLEVDSRVEVKMV